ncbi:MAG: 2-C-methyl-D-erythritol 4-phosphate cytidylyltransferase [Planctomycetota bacterium]|nr:MAG: 2-C-methyl-D-erythritol 4-phosphate cytidylyltransferase [Planctomycetota bacterium]
MASFGVILAAAGRSRRFGAGGRREKKPFVELDGRPVWVRAITPFADHPDVKSLVVVVAADDLQWFKERYRPHLAFLNIEVVSGGSQRADSVRCGLEAVASDCEFVAVHDAARPLIQRKDIDNVFEAAVRYGAAILATRVADTLKRVDESGRVVATVSRDGIWAAQTPQVCRTEWLREAYRKRSGTPTDEAQLLQDAGFPVFVVEGVPSNFKITTAADLKLAEAWLKASPAPKQRSLHPFAEERFDRDEAGPPIDPRALFDL